MCVAEQIWTPAADAAEAWRAILGRQFRGLSPAVYKQPFEQEVEDPYLRRAALTSLERAGDDQQYLYDFSFGSEFNRTRRGPKEGDFGAVVLVNPAPEELSDAKSDARVFIERFLAQTGTKLALVIVSDAEREDVLKAARAVPGFENAAVGEEPQKKGKGKGKGGKGKKKAAAKDDDGDADMSAADGKEANNGGGSSGSSARTSIVHVQVDTDDDPLRIKQLIALKLLLNAHSTAIMARLGRVVGNTMTNVSPSNLKLIGRATSLILTHVNDGVRRINDSKDKDAAKLGEVAYNDANAVLYESIRFLAEQREAAAKAASASSSAGSSRDLGQTAEVALSIIRILEAVRRNAAVSCDEALAVMQKHGLARYLAAFPAIN